MRSPCTMPRYLLTPRHVPAYGQDFLLGEGMETLGITRLFASKTGYAFEANAGKPALFISHNPDDRYDSAFLTALPPSFPVVTHVHLQWGYIDKIERRDWARRAINRASIGVVPTEFMLRMFAAEFPNVLWKVIKYGLNTNRYYPAADNERNLFREKQGFQSEDLLVMHVGALTEAKGLRILEKFVLGMNSEAPCVKLLLQYLGNAQNRAMSRYEKTANDLWNLQPDRIYTHRDEDPLNTDRLLKYCDLLITPSLREVCPLVVLEAFLSGVPVVCLHSTPFYEELRCTKIAENFYTVLPLPARFQELDLERASLDVTEEESENIANQLLAVCNRSKSPSADDRNNLAEQARSSGFTSPRMLEEFRSIYDEITGS